MKREEILKELQVIQDKLSSIQQSEYLDSKNIRERSPESLLEYGAVLGEITAVALLVENIIPCFK